jgi:hypothetical protein
VSSVRYALGFYIPEDEDVDEECRECSWNLSVNVRYKQTNKQTNKLRGP